MAPDGSTFIDRLERIEIHKENELTKDNRIINRRYSKSVLHLKWNIGELIFARQARQRTHQKSLVFRCEET